MSRSLRLVDAQAQMEGHGEQSFSDGTKYSGAFVRGRREGLGTFTERDGARYEGAWANNKRNGQGTFVYASGDVCRGTWRDNVIHGPGEFETKDGWKYNTHYENGQCVKNEANTLFVPQGTNDIPLSPHPDAPPPPQP